MTPTDNHNEVTSRFSGMFNDFLTAAKAMEQLPQLQAKVVQAESERDAHKAVAEARFNAYQDLVDRNQTLNETIKHLEAELAQATFREKEVRDQREVLLSTLRGAVKELSDTSALVDPPVPEVKQEQLGPTASMEPSVVGSDTSHTLNEAEVHPTSGPSAPMTGEPVSQGQSVNHPKEGYDPQRAGQSDRPLALATVSTSPDVSGRTVSSSEHFIDCETSGGRWHEGKFYPNEAEATRSPGAGPFASSTDVSSQVAVSPSNETTDSIPAVDRDTASQPEVAERPFWCP